jgi:hypothetical protein
MHLTKRSANPKPTLTPQTRNQTLTSLSTTYTTTRSPNTTTNSTTNNTTTRSHRSQNFVNHTSNLTHTTLHLHLNLTHPHLHTHPLTLSTFNHNCSPIVYCVVQIGHAQHLNTKKHQTKDIGESW